MTKLTDAQHKLLNFIIREYDRQQARKDLGLIYNDSIYAQPGGYGFRLATLDKLVELGYVTLEGRYYAIPTDAGYAVLERQKPETATWIFQIGQQVETQNHRTEDDELVGVITDRHADLRGRQFFGITLEDGTKISAFATELRPYVPDGTWHDITVTFEPDSPEAPAAQEAEYSMGDIVETVGDEVIKHGVIVSKAKKDHGMLYVVRMDDGMSFSAYAHELRPHTNAPAADVFPPAPKWDVGDRVEIDGKQGTVTFIYPNTGLCTIDLDSGDWVTVSPYELRPYTDAPVQDMAAQEVPTETHQLYSQAYVEALRAENARLREALETIRPIFQEQRWVLSQYAAWEFVKKINGIGEMIEKALGGGDE